MPKHLYKLTLFTFQIFKGTPRVCPLFSQDLFISIITTTWCWSLQLQNKPNPRNSCLQELITHVRFTIRGLPRRAEFNTSKQFNKVCYLICSGHSLHITLIHATEQLKRQHVFQDEKKLVDGTEDL